MKERFSEARISKDKSFDGKFFFGVETTGVFCRPSCPAPIAKEKNVYYFSTIYEALEKGFRPCLRCRPDITIDFISGNPAGTKLVKSALTLIYEGYLHHHSICDLAAELSVSERHLRKLFTDNLGVAPGKIDRYYKVLFAKKLLLYSDQSVSDIAYASGFGSLRQFNDVFKKTFASTPSSVRCQSIEEKQSSRVVTLRINYAKPFDFKTILESLRVRVIKGVEVVTETSYSRTFRTASAEGFFRITDNPAGSCLDILIDCNDIRCYMAVSCKIRKMFDIDTDFSNINRRLGTDPLLTKGMKDGHVPRLSVAYEPFEFVIRAILGQQISVQAATTFAGRIAEKSGIVCPPDFPAGLDYFFPSPYEFQSIDLSSIGITKVRQATLVTVTERVINGKLRLTSNQLPESFHADFSVLKGVGDWTVNYVAMRGLGMVDSFPYNDLGVIKALSTKDKVPTKKEILSIAEQWRPYRSYATLCLWNQGEV